ncbi:MAG: peptidylprolyl isomerase [Lasallia pustulata]|uniref:peptidylprolyl isomerase n=1 Tax=Lasallia pustulata TaxID=136370 RepID=A0A1W5DCF0_9LECA|nr:MAG: peptidylprolyl isomerase [Lasallia pustulata]SLM40766.1 peptidylprolyl isomerase [Lasallia pustulata]
MGVTRKVLKEGNGTDKPKKGDEVTIEYTGNLYDEAQASNNYRGKHFDSSKGRGDFQTKIGVGKVIRGWDEGVTQMSLGERSILTITGDYAYGDSGFPGLIPPNATLIFEVELKGINNKKA